MNTLWFKNKKYGWGWYPASWQGWLVLVIYLVLITVLASSVKHDLQLHEALLTFTLPSLVLTLILIAIAYKTGEPPRWRWGK